MDNTKKRNRVLIAEDEGCLRRLLEEICESAGFHVDSVYEGRAAWALISSLVNVYDVVFLDLSMPEWSGDDVLGMVNTMNSPRKFIVLLSGYLDPKMRADFECHPNVFRVLDKPFSIRDISAILKEIVAESHDE